MDDQAGLVLPRSKARGLVNVRKLLNLIIRNKPVNLGGGEGEKMKIVKQERNHKSHSTESPVRKTKTVCELKG